MTTELEYHHIDAHAQYILGEGAELGLFTHLEYNLAHYSPEVCQRILDEEQAQDQVRQNDYDVLARFRQIIDGWVNTQPAEMKQHIVENNRFVFATYVSLYDYIHNIFKLRMINGTLDQTVQFIQSRPQYQTLCKLREELKGLVELKTLLERSQSFFKPSTNNYFFNTDIRLWRGDDGVDGEVTEIDPRDEDNGEVYNIHYGEGFTQIIGEFYTNRVEAIRGKNNAKRKMNKVARLKQRHDRAVLKRAYKMASSFGHTKHVNMLINRDKVYIGEDNSDLIFEFSVRRPTFDVFTQVGHGLLHVRLLNREKEHLSSMCVYIEDTPNIDQFVAFSSLIENGCEDMILEKANFFNISAKGRKHPRIRRYGKLRERAGLDDAINFVRRTTNQIQFFDRKLSKRERVVVEGLTKDFMKSVLEIDESQMKELHQLSPWPERGKQQCRPVVPVSIGSPELQRALFNYNNPVVDEYETDTVIGFGGNYDRVVGDIVNQYVTRSTNTY